MLTKFLMTHRDEEADAMTRNRCQISNISLMLTAPFYSSLFRKKVDPSVHQQQETIECSDIYCASLQ